MFRRALSLRSVRDFFPRCFSTSPAPLISHTTQKTVVIGMSGGVDSSVSAYLLKQQGYNVVGLFMTNWDTRDEFGYCTGDEDRRDASLVCEQLKIPFHEVNFVKDYWTMVFERTMSDFEQGLTPNPDVLCNRYIKFEAFSNYAIRQFGAHYIATGHYARTKKSNDGTTLLLAGADKEKDQSYFLSMVRPRSLDSVLFPVGEMTKSQVREIARNAGLVTAERKNSVGFCFVGKRKFSDFISEYIPDRPGDITLLTENGNARRAPLQHRGVHNYTIGQRIGIDGSGTKMYVCRKDVKENVLYVAPLGHPSFFSDSLIAHVSWIKGEPPSGKFSCLARNRYRQCLQPVTVTVKQESLSDPSCQLTGLDRLDSTVLVEFDNPTESVTQGQVIVFYSEDFCLGGGIINEVGLSYFAQQKPLPRELVRATNEL